MDGTCPTFTAKEGWCSCTEELIIGLSVAPALHLGKAVYRKFYDDTKKFRDKAVADAAAKSRKRPSLGLTERRERLRLVR